MFEGALMRKENTEIASKGFLPKEKLEKTARKMVDFTKYFCCLHRRSKDKVCG